MSAHSVHIRVFVLLAAASLLPACGTHQKETPTTNPADSIVQRYQLLRDSVTYTWSALKAADSQKIQSMKKLAVVLARSNDSDQDLLESIDQRIQDLNGMRFTQQNLGDVNVVEEYDFAASSLVNELTAQAEEETDYDQDSLTQQIVDALRSADDESDSLRDQYDAVAARLNAFVSGNPEYLGAEKPSHYPLFDSVAHAH